VVNSGWISNEMKKTDIRLKDIATDTGIDYSQLSGLITGNRELSQPMKALFYFYFQWKDSKAE
jgi:hypothetical protein